ncbi:hypothetical protein ASD56_13195 [Microbacterium sp. Root166]|nr:hypothetical protein ASD56_13195 [Microbacterium sp. Root166]
MLLAIAAVAIGIIALIKGQPKVLAITGTALGGVALIAGLIATISFTSFVSTNDSSPDRVVVGPSAEATEPGDAPEEAAPEEEATAEESAELGTVENPYPQPYVAVGLFGGEKYSLTARLIDANANALVEGWNQFNSDAPAGFKYVVVELTMTGIDPDGVEPSLAEWDLTLATAEGNQYNNEYIVFGDGMPSMLEGPTLYPGSTFTGHTAYLVPDTAQSFLLHDNGNYIAF